MRKVISVVGKVLSCVFATTSVLLMAVLCRLQMLPVNILIPAGVIFAALIGLVALGVWTKAKLGWRIAAVVLAVLLIAVQCVGIGYVWKALKTFDSISGGTTETVHIGIYVRSDDVNDYNEMASTYRHGILQTIDRESTDRAIRQINEKLETQITCVEYQRLPELIDGLLDGQVDAIILNQAFLSMLEDMGGYAEKLPLLREAVLKEVEVEVETPESTGDNTANEDEDQAVALKPFVLYISGVDTRGPVTVRSRSDVNIIAAVNPQTRQVVLVSTPRDYFVPLSISDGMPDKLTHAGNYGVKVSMDTLGMLYDINVDYYFRVNFSGFEKIIDALGGVTVVSEVAFSSVGYTFAKGENTLDGKAALVFSRERYSFSGGDRQRGRNQMAMIKAVINKAMSPALLKNYAAVMESVKGNFETSVPMDVIAGLVSNQLQDGGSWNVVTCSADGTGDYQVPYSSGHKVYVMWPNYETVDKAKALIQSVLNGEIISN